MTLVIDLPEPLEARLEAEATRAGVRPADLAAEFIKKNLASTGELEELKRLNAPSIALLQSWLADAPTDPAAIQEAEKELLEFKRAMNAPRKESGARIPFPEAE